MQVREGGVAMYLAKTTAVALQNVSLIRRRVAEGIQTAGRIGGGWFGEEWSKPSSTSSLGSIMGQTTELRWAEMPGTRGLRAR
jgi:hypothetical protein